MSKFDPVRPIKMSVTQRILKFILIIPNKSYCLFFLAKVSVAFIKKAAHRVEGGAGASNLTPKLGKESLV